jgi:ZIP family zinc transporter
VDYSPAFLGFILSVIAGFSTMLGVLAVIYNRSLSTTYLSAMLGVSAGVMVSLSLIELVPTAVEELGNVVAFSIFFISLIIYYVVEIYITKLEQRNNTTYTAHKKLYRIGIAATLALLIHNIPEGIITLTGTLVEEEYGIMLALAIMIHNIPEGVVIAVPMFRASDSKSKTVKFGLVASIAEPFGAIIAIVFLSFFQQNIVIYASLAFVAGIMVGLSVVDILPAANEFGRPHQTFFGFFIGLIIVSGVLTIFHH